MSLTVDIEKKLHDITLRAAFDTTGTKGITGILGASGCGKSMTLKCIAGIMKPDRGRIVLNGRVLFDSEKGIDVKVQERKVGYLFQNYALFPHMTVLENVSMALDGSKKERREKAEYYLKLFHMEKLVDRYPSRLSGGQQQRTALARIMASQPDVFLLDEPFSALDYYLKEILQLELLEELSGYQGDVLLVTHSRDEIYRLCETIHVMNEGHMEVSGGVKEVFTEPRTLAAARLTGCKNMVKICYETPHTFYVPDWKLRVIMKDRTVSEHAGWIGIRAHYLRAAKDPEEENVLECRLNRLLDDPFEIVLILENGIWWKIPKDRWKEEFHQEMPGRVVVPEESIFFLEDGKQEVRIDHGTDADTAGGGRQPAF